MKLSKVTLALLVCSITPYVSAGVPLAQGELSANIAVLSSYNLRGMTNDPENDKVAVQGGVQYDHKSGFYAGYWGSTLDYNLENNPSTSDNSFENNLYAGYNYQVNDDLSFTLGGTYYLYYPSDDANVFETLVSAQYKNASLSAQTLTDDVVWGNAGDTYLLASYSQPLKHDFSFNTAVGAYYYKKNGEFITDTKESFAFRHATLGLSRDWENGLGWSLDYIVGSDDRMGVKQKNKVVMGLSYSF